MAVYNGNTYLDIEFVGALAKDKVDIKVGSVEKTSMLTDMSGLEKILITNKTGSDFHFNCLYVMVDGSTLFSVKKKATMTIPNGVTANLSLLEPKTKYEVKDATSLSFTTSGTKKVTIQVMSDELDTYKLTSDLTVEVLPLVNVGLSIKTQPTKKQFYKNENFTYSGLEVTTSKCFQIDGSVYQQGVEVNSYSVEEIDTTVVGDKNVSISYYDAYTDTTYYASYLVNIAGVSKITYSSEPQKTQFEINEELSGQPQYAVIYYTDGVSSQVNLTNWEYNFSNEGLKTVSCSFLSPKTNEQYTYSYVVNVSENQVTPTVQSATLSLNKSVFNEGELFTIAGSTLTVTLTDGTVKNASITGNSLGHFIRWGDGNNTQIIASNPIRLGTIVEKDNATTSQTFQFEYEGQVVTTSSVTINVKYYDGIRISQTYFQNGFYIDYAFDLDQVVVETIYKTTNSSVVEYTRVYGFTSSIADGYVFTEEDIGGVLYTVTYNGTSTFLNFNVKDNFISIYSTVLQGKTFNYIEEQQINLLGITVKATYQNKNDVDITNQCKFFLETNNGEVEVNNNVTVYSSMMKTGTQKLIADWNGKRAVVTSNFSVSYKTISSLELVEGYTFSYVRGDAVSLNGLAVKVNYDNGQNEVVDVDDGLKTYYKDGEYKELKDGKKFTSSDNITEVKLSYTYRSSTKELIITNVSLSNPSIVGIKAYISDSDRELIVGTSWNINEKITVKPVYSNNLETSQTLSGWTTTSTPFLVSNTVQLESGKAYGIRTITVSHSSFSYNVDVSVIPSSIPNSIYAKYEGGKLYVGDKIKKSDFEVYALFPNLDYYVRLFNFGITPEEGTELTSSGTRKVSVNYSGLETDTSITTFLSTGNGTLTTYKIVPVFGKTTGELFETVFYDEVRFDCGIEYDSLGNIIGGTLMLFKSADVSKDNNENHKKTYGLNVTNKPINYSVGYIKFGSNGENSQITLWSDYANPLGTDGNIVVKFPHYVEGLADRINKCRFGTIYNERLFISGNDEYKNFDWHSEPQTVSTLDLETNGDFTYFSDLNYCKYGSDETAINGYSIYTDGDLLVSKGSSGEQSTLYRREKTLTTAVDYSGSTIEGQYELQFPMFDVNSFGGEGSVSDRAVMNFVGESLVLTRTGLKAIVSKENIYADAKFSADVSSYINTKLKEEDLTNAFMYAFKEELLLNVGEGTYVGYNENRNDNNEYEWYYIDGFKPTLFFEKDDELYFGDEQGKLSRFDKSYKDKDRTFIGNGGVSLILDEETSELVLYNEVTVSSKYKDNIQEDSVFHLISHYSEFNNEVDEDFEIHANLGDFLQEQVKANVPISYTDNYVGTFNYDSVNKWFYIDLDNSRAELKEFYDNRQVFLDNTTSNTFINHPAYLKKLKTDSVTKSRFALYDRFGKPLMLNGEEKFRMSYRISSLDKVYITDVSDDKTKFKLTNKKTTYVNGVKVENRIKLIKYFGTDAVYSAVVTSSKPVEAYYVTKPYDMGSIAYAKNIWSWAIANDTYLRSEMDIQYFSSRVDKYRTSIQSVAGAKNISKMNELSFGRIHFTTDELPQIFTKQRALTNVGYIRFKFDNNNDTNMVLTKLSIVYTFGQVMKGVK